MISTIKLTHPSLHLHIYKSDQNTRISCYDGHCGWPTGPIGWWPFPLADLISDQSLPPKSGVGPASQPPTAPPHTGPVLVCWTRPMHKFVHWPLGIVIIFVCFYSGNF